MATSQQVQFAETIRAMKLALKRKADDSDSDESIHAPTNRGHKLQRRAKAVRYGRLDTTAPAAYRRPVRHAGYTRHVISTNPRLYDDDGDLVDPADSDAEPHHAEPLDDDAFADVRLDSLLRPLTSPAELADHPSLSLAYKSTALTELTRQAEEMVRRERAKLWKAKRLLRRFLGDTEWVPCGVFEAEHDGALLGGGADEADVGSVPGSIPTDEVPGPPMQHDTADPSETQTKANGSSIEGVEIADMAAASEDQKAQHPDHQPAIDEPAIPAAANGEASTTQETAQPPQPDHLEHPTLKDLRAATRDPENGGGGSEESSTSGRDTNGPSHSMTTRARARSPAQSRTPSPSLSDSSTLPSVNPWFLIPDTSLPTRTLNLPPREADETRQLLFLYVQRQEHAVRLLGKLFAGLQRADRLRREVHRAAKADAHVGEMSDGEDWYDVEDWGLGKAELKMGKDGVWGLEKGKDEVDDVTGAGAGEEEGRRAGRGRRRAVRI